MKSYQIISRWTLNARCSWRSPGRVLPEDGVDRYPFRLKMDQTRQVRCRCKKALSRRCLKRRVWRRTDGIGRFGPLVLNGRSSVTAHRAVRPRAYFGEVLALIRPNRNRPHRCGAYDDKELTLTIVIDIDRLQTKAGYIRPHIRR